MSHLSNISYVVVLNPRILAKSAGYNKFLVPPPVGKRSMLELNMSVDVVDILLINEVKGYFRTRFVLLREWLDPQLTYRDLKKDSRLNLLSPTEQETVWFPEVVFENVASDEDWMEIVLSKEYNIVRNIEDDDIDPVGVTAIDNTFIFSGEENSHFLTKEFTILWICNFNMMWYPFDTQTCAMQFKIVNKFADLVDLSPQNLTYSGPSDLAQYIVKSYKMCRVKIQSSNRERVDIEISLGRPLIANILTVFIPTIILLVISHLANVFDQEYLDMVIMVNLTVLLVLATL